MIRKRFVQMWFRCYAPDDDSHDNYGPPDIVRDNMMRGVLSAFEMIDNGAVNVTHGVTDHNPYWIKTPEALRPRGLADE